MRRLARFVILRRWIVIALALVGVAAAGAFGGGVADKLSLGGFGDPDADSSQAADVLDEEFASSTADLVLVVTAGDGDVDSEGSNAAGLALTEAIEAEEGVTGVTSHWAIGLGELSPLRSTDGSQALLIAALEGDDDDLVERSGELSEEYTGEHDGLTVAVTGRGEVTRQVSEQSEADLQRAEAISLPVTLVALIIVFGSVVAALLPLLVGIVAVVGTFLVLTILTGFTDVSVFALNVTTAMGLGLGIDYSLFVVSRYREEQAAGHPMPAALAHTMQTAGRTVAFSAATVAISLAALLLFPIPYVQSFAYAGVAVVVLAAVSRHRRAARGARRARAPGREGQALPPAHPQRGRGPLAPPGHAGDGPPRPVRGGRHRRPPRAGRPVPDLETGTVDDRVLPESATSRAALDDLREDFGGRETAALTVVLPDGADPDALDAYAASLSGVPDVVRVDAITGSYQDGAQLAPAELIPDTSWPASGPRTGPTPRGSRSCPPWSPSRPRARPWWPTLRDVDAPGEVLVGGTSAELVDTKAAIADRLPYALGLIAVVDLRPAVLHGGQPAGARQGPGAQRPEPHRHLRGHGVDLPGGPPGRACSASRRPASST